MNEMSLTQKIESGYYKGFFRIIVGIILIIVSIGGIETSTEILPLQQLIFLIIGLVSLMYGVKASNKDAFN